MLDFFRPVPKRRTIKLIKKSGVLFNDPGKLGRSLFHLGNGLLIGALLYTIYLYYPLADAVLAYWQISQNTSPTVVISGEPTSAPIPTPTVTEIGTTEYSISIPKIGAYASIVDGISPFDQKAYSQVLKDRVVAQAKGSSRPGMGNGSSTFIFAHSTEQGLSMVRQNAIFYLLGELKDGDVFFVNDKGKIFTYKVYMRKIVNASEIEYLKYSDPSKEVLIMQTCWPLGTDWKRLLVFGERVL
ncbi:sortase [Candidatus Shapirobacteria bacterium]|nr:sortase [Candidatus Shapirobacteria bacterium]